MEQPEGSPDNDKEEHGRTLNQAVAKPEVFPPQPLGRPLLRPGIPCHAIDGGEQAETEEEREEDRCACGRVGTREKREGRSHGQPASGVGPGGNERDVLGGEIARQHGYEEDLQEVGQEGE